MFLIKKKRPAPYQLNALVKQIILLKNLQNSLNNISHGLFLWRDLTSLMTPLPSLTQASTISATLFSLLNLQVCFFLNIHEQPYSQYVVVNNNTSSLI